MDAEILSLFGLLGTLAEAFDGASALFDAFTEGVAVYDAIQDTLSPELEAGALLFEGLASGLLSRIADLFIPTALSPVVAIPTEVALPAIAAPIGIDLLSLLSQSTSSGDSGIDPLEGIGMLIVMAISQPTGAAASLLGMFAGLSATGAGAILAAAALAILLLIHFIGGGCGDACIEASKGEQIYECAANNLLAIAEQLGMLSYHDFYTLVNACLSAGTIHMQILGKQGDPKAEQGLNNMTTQIEKILTDGATLPFNAPHAMDITAAQAVYLSPSTPGWYSSSIQAGAQVTTALLTATADGINAVVIQSLAAA
jgi:hypothetical protein